MSDEIQSDSEEDTDNSETEQNASSFTIFFNSLISGRSLFMSVWIQCL